MSAYNYESFPLDMDGPIFAGFRDALRPGMKAPDGELTDARRGAASRCPTCGGPDR